MSSSDPDPRQRGSKLFHLWQYLRGVWPGFFVGALFLLSTNLLALRIPREIGAAVEHLQLSGDGTIPLEAETLQTGAITIALLALGAAISRILSRIFTFNAARKIEHALRGDLYHHLTTLPEAYFQKQATGDLVSRTINDVSHVRVLYGVGILHVVNTTVAYVIVLGLMTNISLKLTLYSLAPYPIILLSMRALTRAIYTRTQDVQTQLSAISARAQENLSGAAVVKAFNIQSEEEAAFQKLSEDYETKNLALARVRGAMIPYMGAVSSIGTLIVLWLGGAEVMNGEITLGKYVEFSSYIVTLSWPTIAMGWVLSIWNRGMAAFDRLREILTETSTIADPHNPAPLSQTETRALRFENVSLTYEDGTPCLHQINLEIKPGTRVAIVGRTGSGKTSLVHLIARLRDPSSGRIFLGEDPLKNLKLTDLRSYIGYVPQDPFLFSMTVEENLRFGAPEATQEELDKALVASHLKDDLSTFPNGLETVVGERGITLSGGQKQRATIARALLLDPRLLILDDALASVDTQTERAILSRLDAIMKSRTSIFVTHRFNALDLFDEVIVLDQGRIVERGHHRDLLQADGLYADLHRKQTSREEDA